MNNTTDEITPIKVIKEALSMMMSRCKFSAEKCKEVITECLDDIGDFMLHDETITSTEYHLFITTRFLAEYEHE